MPTYQGLNMRWMMWRGISARPSGVVLLSAMEGTDSAAPIILDGTCVNQVGRCKLKGLDTRIGIACLCAWKPSKLPRHNVLNQGFKQKEKWYTAYNFCLPFQLAALQPGRAQQLPHRAQRSGAAVLHAVGDARRAAHGRRGAGQHADARHRHLPGRSHRDRSHGGAV